MTDDKTLTPRTDALRKDIEQIKALNFESALSWATDYARLANDLERENTELREQLAQAKRLRPEVAAFAEAMEAKLRENDHKQHWSHVGMQYLSMRLTQEREELRKAVEIGNPDEVLREAADVANFAMMIADMMRRYPREED